MVAFFHLKIISLNSIQKSVDDFTLGILRVARSMICLPPKCGGFGLFKFDKFLGSQKCFWILNADRSLRDNWRCDIFSRSFGNCLSFSSRRVDPLLHPVLHGLGGSLEKLRVCHDPSNENYLKATLLFNPMNYRGPGDKQTLDPLYLECENDLPLCCKIGNLTIG